MKRSVASSRSFYVGIEGGATTTTALSMTGDGRVIRQAQGGPCNIRLTGDPELLRLLLWLRTQIAPRFKDGFAAEPTGVGLFLAGCRTVSDKMRMTRALKSVWANSHLIVGNDSTSAVAAALGEGDGIMVICGTGSIVRAQHGARTLKIGGWGHVGGDKGSGYWMGRELLRSIFQSYDMNGSADLLAQATLPFLGLNSIEEIVQWSLSAPKDEIASLTKILFRFPRHPSSRHIIEEAAGLLARDVALAARKVGFKIRSKTRLPVALNPGLAKHQPLFHKILARAIRSLIPLAKVFVSSTEGAVGAAILATRTTPKNGAKLSVDLSSETLVKGEHRPSTRAQRLEPRGLAQALTEQRNPRTLNLDRQSIPELVQTMLAEEGRTLPAIRAESASLEKVISWIVTALRNGGRLFYVGAGTSGRMGVLDAAECPPTFGTSPEMVQGIIAGGARALLQAVESLEDSTDYGKHVVRERGIGSKDVLIGIAASGSTPFVLGALREAHSRGTHTVLLTFNPRAEFQIPGSRFLRVAIATGPEAITGSTRLKAGTATKIVLNLFSSIAMIRLGKVKSNFMVDLSPTCEKLHDRATRIYSTLRKVSYPEAWKRLEQNDWNLKALLK